MEGLNLKQFGIYPIRGIMGWCHLLVGDRRQAVLLDTGLVGEVWGLRRCLRQRGLQPSDIKAILPTHGHLDHAGNLTAIQRWCGAPVYTHPAERDHVAGTYAYSDTSQWCGRLEAMGRFILRYQPGQIDEALQDGQEVPFWGGLEVIHLPGHTAGHCGFYSKRADLLFSGDLFASYFFNTHLPPPILNSVPRYLLESLRRVRQLNPKYILPNHYDFYSGALHRRRFDRHYSRFLTQSGSEITADTV